MLPDASEASVGSLSIHGRFDSLGAKAILRSRVASFPLPQDDARGPQDDGEPQDDVAKA